MAASDDFTGILGNLTSGLFDISGKILIGILVFVLIIALMYYFIGYRRKFDIVVNITSQRAGDPAKYSDKGAILKDKKGNKYFKLLRSRVQLQVPPFKVIETIGKVDYLNIWRKSEDEFVFLTQPRIDKEHIIRADGKKYPVASTKQGQIESDIEWTVRRREQNKKFLDPEHIFMKLLAWAPQIISSTFLLIILWIFMDKLPSILSQLSDLVREMQSMRGAVIAAG